MKVYIGEFDAFLKDFFIKECRKRQFSNIKLKPVELLSLLLDELEDKGGYEGTEEDAIKFIYKYWDGAIELYNNILDDFLIHNYKYVKDGIVATEKLDRPYQNPILHPKEYAYWMIYFGLINLLSVFKEDFFESEEVLELNDSCIHEWETRLYKNKNFTQEKEDE